MERYISFTKTFKDSEVKFRFIDSFRFLSSSLDKLSSYLSKDSLYNLRKEFIDLNESQFNLLCRKGVFPYDYVDSFCKLDEPQLPPKQDFL